MDRNEATFRALAENSPDIIGRIDRNYRYVYINPAAEPASGLPAAAFIGKNHDELGFPPELAAYCNHVYRSVFHSGQEGKKEFDLPGPHGIRSYVSRVVPEYGPDGKVETLLSVTRDVTDTKRLERAMQQHNNELRQLNAALEQKNRELSHLNQEKNEFLAIAAHDLKNPLGNILMRVEYLLEENDAPLHGSTRDDLNRIGEATHHMLDVIGKLLNISAIESGVAMFTPQLIELDELLANVCAGFQQQCTVKQQTLDMSCPADLRCYANQEAMMLILENLLSNASKFAQPKTAIHCGVTVLQETHLPFRLRLYVSDQGPGLSAEEQAGLFHKFARMSPQPTGGEHCSGLGLFTVKKLVSMMGGCVGVDSVQGQGSTFWVELPG